MTVFLAHAPANRETAEALEKFLDRHHRFAFSVTMFQIAIALCAIAALTRRRRLWVLGLTASAVGFALFVHGFMKTIG